MSLVWPTPSSPLAGTVAPPAERPGRVGLAVPGSAPARPPGSTRRRAGRTEETGPSPLRLPARLFDRPSSVLVYGPSRPLVNLAVFALAEATTPNFHWVDLSVPGEERLAVDPVRLGWIDPDRLWTVENPAALRPDELGADAPVFALVRFDEPPATVHHITEFLRLPEISQRILATPLPARGPGVVAVPNAHRVMAAFPPERVAPILQVHRDAGYSVYVGFADSAGDGRREFDYVFRLDGESLAGWESSRVVCEKGVSDGPMAGESPVSFRELPVLADVLRRAHPSV